MKVKCYRLIVILAVLLLFAITIAPLKLIDPVFVKADPDPPEQGTIIVTKVTNPSPDSTDTSFTFAAGGGLTPGSFSLKDGQSYTFNNVAPGSGYSISETVPAGWTLTSATCSNGSNIGNIVVSAGETVTVTFTNIHLTEWTIVDTPDSEPDQIKQIYSPEGWGSEIIKLLIGNNGTSMYALIRENRNTTTGIRIYKSINRGVSWSNAINTSLASASGIAVANLVVWDMALPPDDSNTLIVAISDLSSVTLTWPQQQVWITTDGGTNWANTNWVAPAPGSDIVSTMDISMEYGSRDILVGTRDGTGLGTNNLQTIKFPDSGWNIQDATGTPASTNPFTGDVIVAKFSPTYVGDSTIAVVYSDADSTKLMTGVHDLLNNTTAWQAAGLHVEIKNTSSAVGDSPDCDEIITADMDLPSDFSGQSTSLRRFYICTDAIDTPGSDPAKPDRGVYRVDDNVIYTLMDNTTTFATATDDASNRRAHSIAYWGTYASGKLLVGETLGRVCEAAVPTWFTDSPTLSPYPYWYPAKKPTSGAAGYAAAIDCGPDQYSWGNAWVEWSPTYSNQGVAYVVTGSSKLDDGFNLPVVGDFGPGDSTATAGWPSGFGNTIYYDESAFNLTRSNGEIWNQLALIDTRMSKLTDVAPSTDGTTVYLASVNNAACCKGFDSIWRSSTNENVVENPIPALPIGQIWERVRVTPTNTSCSMDDSNYIIIRLAPDKLNGQVVFWAAGGVDDLQNHAAGPDFTALGLGSNTKKLEWSPDYGDYFANITSKLDIQDMEAESSTMLYVMNTAGSVQKIPYTGIAWSNANDPVSTEGGGHTIDVQAGGIVLVTGTDTSTYPAAISTNGADSFTSMVIQTSGDTPTAGYHGIIDTDYADNETIYIGNDAAATGMIYRNNAPSGSNSTWTNIVTPAPGTAHREYYGLAQVSSGIATGVVTLYAAHDAGAPNNAAYCGVERTLDPVIGIPDPGITWNCLDSAAYFQNQGTIVEFTLEPKSLKLCSCTTQDADITLYAIDDDWYANNHNTTIGHGGVAAVRDRGMLWSRSDIIHDIIVSPTSVDFGSIVINSTSASQTVTASNKASATSDLNIGTIILGGPDADQFSIQNDNCSGQTLTPGASATLEVVFNPTSAGNKTATLSIPSNDPDEDPVNVALTGTGTIPLPTITGVNPNTGVRGQSLNITITGTYFNGATVVNFGANITVNNFAVDSATQITANITIAATATTGTRNVTVATPGGTGILNNGFTINLASAPPKTPETSSAPSMNTPNPARITVPVITVAPQQTVVNQPVIIYTNIVNRGDMRGTYKAELKIDGEIEQTKSGSIGANRGMPLTFTVQKDEPGTYEVDINGQKSYFTIVDAKSSKGNPTVNPSTFAYIFAAVLILATLIFGILVYRRIN